MEVDVTTVITALDGSNLKRPDTSKDKIENPDNPEGPKVFPLKDFTLRDACIDALNAQFEDEKDIGVDEKFNRFELSLAISENDELELEPEECTKIITLLAKGFPSNVVGRCGVLLGKTLKKKDRTIVVKAA